jgi:cytoskeletal protein RodZ
MANFGEQLRTERVSRGISLEQITNVTKISQRHLIALEQERFNQLPGGILNKGIVRGYVNVLGLDADEWVARYNSAYSSSGQMYEEDRNWVDFATNVGRTRLDRHEIAAMRLRWLATLLLLLVTAAAVYLAIRYYGLHAGWWPTLLPSQLHINLPHWLTGK